MRLAHAEEAGALSEHALRSKAHWGYDERFLDACRADLTLRPEEVDERRTVLAEASGQLVGFYTLDGVPPEGELGNLWIEPSWLHRGVGRRLWQHAVQTAREHGFRSISIGADPNAEGFYLTMGTVRVGETPSTAIPGRFLPRLRFRLSAT
ncbi:GNAT family N-acetyltransferase [Micromonospora sp. WMMD1102]|uniref:GNAT family N-acetyltransferase n=1 Tax=Micromonospora sp. WMMD1102 TaxID=3016105 RepID=UPI00241573BF|nr:GNAT family N-acetyltransferase [Micromonospora sp. WMMD1102]MDG4787925.1 GNAT family N-acetyltransferase [Micromonospora sp. WMMD1102]